MTPQPAPGHARRTATRAVLLLACGAGLATVLTSAPARCSGPARAAPAAARPSSGFSLRQVLLQRRDAAMGAGDLAAAAAVHADLAHEAVLRARAAHDAWLGARDPGTRLFPDDMRRPDWSYRDTAADLFCFLILASHWTGAESMPLLRQTMEAERALVPAGALCGTVDAETLEPREQTDAERMFGTVEYAKDGLLGLYERTGDAAVRARLIEIADAVIAHSRHRSRSGPIPSDASEVNGSALQVFSRLACIAENPAYAEMAARIADAVTGQMLPANGGFPAEVFDYENDRAVRPLVQLRDHGNELTAGLGEVYALAVANLDQPAWRGRADRWAEPVARMFELIFEHGVTAEGVLVTQIDPAGPRQTDASPSDNWGYVLCGAIAFTTAAQRHGAIDSSRLDRILAAVDRTAAAVAATDGVAWERERNDGYADSLESALYVAAYRPGTAGALLPWVDDQAELFYHWQQPGGFIEETYLDGNFIRTCLLYADLRSGGWRLEPWSPHARVGFAAPPAPPGPPGPSKAGGEMALVVLADRPYTGSLVRDHARPAADASPPVDWARINSWPRWMTQAESLRVTRSEGMGELRAGAAPADSIPLSLPAGGRAVLWLSEGDPR